MGFDWTNEESSARAAMLPEGYHRAKVVRVMRAPKNKAEFVSQNGDPQLMVVYQNAAGQEGAAMYTISDKAFWKLHRAISRMGLDLDKMKASNVLPSHFANQKFAETNLMNREVWICVEHKTSKNNKVFCDIETFRDDELPPDVLAMHRPPGTPAPTTPQTPRPAQVPPVEPVQEDQIPF